MNFINPESVEYSYEVSDSIKKEWQKFVAKFPVEVNEVNKANTTFFYAGDSFALETFGRVLSGDSLDKLKTGAGSVVKRLHGIVSDMHEFTNACENYSDNPDESGMFTLAFCDKLNKLLCVDARRNFYDDARRQAAMDEAAKNIESMSDAKIRMSARDAIDDGNEMADMIQAIESVGNLCSDEAGESMNVSSAEKLMKSDKKLKEKLIKIARAMGRFKAMAQGALSKRAESGKSELFGTKLGSEIPNLITSEISKLAIGGAIGAEVAGRIVNGNAMQFAFRGKQKEGMGPVLVYVDGSGSMMEMLNSEETCEEWAKALGITISMIANNQKRTFKYRQFTTMVHHDGGLNNSFTADQMIRALRFFPCGGTDLYAPIADAARTIKEEKAFTKADLVIITDGVCYDNFKDVIKQVKSRGVRFHLIKLGNFKTPLDAHADFNYTIFRGSTEKEIESIFSRIAAPK